MRNRSLIAAVFVLAGLPLLAQDDRHQSYVTYDESDSVLVQNDGKEVDVRVNLPVYPGDEVRAARRGRTELRLADGNVVALDRESVVKFQSMLMNFEEAGEQTVVTLLSGHVVVYRRYEGSEPLRLDTQNASFVADKESIYGVEANSRGVDVATVFEGSVEVRTPKGTTLLNAGDRAKIDPTGVYDRRAISNVAATEFERWFLARSERYANKESRHLDSSLAYAEDDLNENGRWVYVKDYDQWAWSPYVSTGWRPYYYGYWGWGAGGSNWISYEPWGWVPYHYGSWANVGSYGWMWFPGYVYSPAWVYWAWGPSWVGWVPWGYYSYYSGYYPWLYDPYCNPRVYGQYGFRGHVTVSSGDLGAYTIVDQRTLYSNRVDRAALTSDAVRDRLAREGGRATFTNQPPRINRTDMKDPSTAVDRIIRGSRDGSGTGSVGAGSSGDLTQFFQRDPALSQDIRDRVTRGQSGTVAATTSTRGRNTLPTSSGGSAGGATTVPGRGVVRGGGGSGGTIDRPATTTGGAATPTTGTTIPRGGGTSTVPRGGGSTTGGTSGSTGNTVDTPATNRPRGGTTPRTQQPAETPTTPVPRSGTDTPTVDRSGSNGATSSSGGAWRGRPVRGSTTGSSSNTTGTLNPRTTVRDGGDNPVSRPSPPGNSSSSTSTRGSGGETWRGTGDTVRRVIGSIGGARLTPTSTRGSTSSGGKGGSGTSTRSGSGSSSKPSGRSGGGSSSGSGSVSRPSSGSSSPSTSGGSSRPSGSSSGGSSSSGSRSSGGGGKVNRGG